MTIDELKKLVVQDLDEALDKLDNIFGNDNATLNDLNDKFINQPIGFDKESFRGRVKAFIRKEKEFINDFLKFEQEDLDNPENRNNIEEDIFSVLSSLDFKEQTNKFSGLLKKRTFSTFWVRGDNECGQSWLIHKLIKKEIPESEVLKIEESGVNFLEDIITQLQSITHTDFYPKDKQEFKFENIAENFARTCSKHYVIIIKCIPDFVKTQDFIIFYNHFIKHFTPRARNLKHKIVLFLKDTTNLPYQLSNDFNYWCCETQNSFEMEKEFLTKWKDETNIPYLVDLHRIKFFDTDLIWSWVDSTTELVLKEKLKDKNTIERLIIEEYENGNPQKVLEDVSQLLKYNPLWKTKY